MKMKSLTKLALVLHGMIALLLFAGCGKSGQSNQPAERTVSIGAVLPLTGAYAQYGQNMKRGIEMAVADALEQGTLQSNRLNVVFEDGQIDVKNSLSAFNKLKDVDHISAVIAATSKILLAIKPLANANQIVMMNASAISPEIEDQPDFCFSILPNATKEGAFLADSVFKTLNLKKGVILYRDDASGKAFETVFKDRFTALGGEILLSQPHKPEEADYRPLLAKVRDISGVEFIFVPSFGPEVATLTKQARELNQNYQLITYEAFNTPKSIEIAGDAAEGIIFGAPTFGLGSDTPNYLALKKRVNAKYGMADVPFQLAANYDAMTLLIEAVSHSANSGKEIKDSLASMKEFKGVTGQMAFDQNGAVTMELGLYTVHDHVFRPYHK